MATTKATNLGHRTDVTLKGTTTTVDSNVVVSDTTTINNAGSDVGLKINSTSTGNIMQLQDNGTDVMVVADGGKVGIGTSSPPSEELEIQSNTPAIKLSDTDESGSYGTVSMASSVMYLQANGASSDGTLIYRSGNAGTFTERMRIDSNGKLSITESAQGIQIGPDVAAYTITRDSGGLLNFNATQATFNGYIFDTADGERMRIDSSGNLLVGKTSNSTTSNGIIISENSGDAYLFVTNTSSSGSSVPVNFNKQNADGTIVALKQANITEGSISVSGTTVSYNGGHLSRWSQLPDNSKDESIVKGTVMTNLDAMCEWSHADEYWTEEDELPVDEKGNPTAAVGDLKKAAFTEDNEQLNRMVVSSVEGDPNVAGVFVNWDNDDDGFNDMNIAMTGDMVIRIAQGVTVEKGQLLMSAGDGTAKPQGDDIVKNKTIAKVTSNYVSHTYDDGSFCVPCVLMAC